MVTHRNPKIRASHLPKYQSKYGIHIESTGIHIKPLQLQPVEAKFKILTTYSIHFQSKLMQLSCAEKEWNLTCILGQAMTHYPALAKSISSSWTKARCKSQKVQKSRLKENIHISMLTPWTSVSSFFAPQFRFPQLPFPYRISTVYLLSAAYRWQIKAGKAQRFKLYLMIKWFKRSFICWLTIKSK